MTDTDTKDEAKKRLGLARPGGRLELRSETGQVRQSFSHGRSKTVQVEVKKKRLAPPPPPPSRNDAKPAPSGDGGRPQGPRIEPQKRPQVLRALTDEERAARARAVHGAVRDEVVRAKDAESRRVEDEARRRADEERRRTEDDE